MATLGATLSTATITSDVVVNPTPSATVTITVTAGTVFIWTAGEAETINASGVQTAGQELTCIITNDATLGRTLTFGTGFKSIGVLLGTISKIAVIKFVSDGTNLCEIARTLAL